MIVLVFPSYFIFNKCKKSIGYNKIAGDLLAGFRKSHTRMKVILSPYFSVNTKLVACFCRRCYLKEDDVLITAVNIKFLENADPKHYFLFKNNFFYTSRSKSKRGSSDEESQDDSIIQNTKTKMNSLNIDPRIKRKCFKLQENQNEMEKIKHESEVKHENKEEQIKNNSNYNEHIGDELKKESDRKIFGTDDSKNIVKWIPPISPHNLIEEKYYNDPWALLVATIFLNRTSCFLALPYMEKFFEDFKGPYDVLKVATENLEPYFTKIGLVRTRANQVWRMSHDFVNKEWKNVGELYGVGKYAEDAYKMFHLGDFNVEPTDRYLKIYKAWYEMKEKNEKLGIRESNSQVYLEDYYVTPEDEDRTEDI